MTESVATAVLNEAATHGFNDDPLPESEQARVESASEIVDEAIAAWNNGARGLAVKAIIATAGRLDDNGELIEERPDEAEASGVVPEVRDEVGHEPDLEAVDVQEPEVRAPLDTPYEPSPTLAEPKTIVGGFGGAIEAKELAIAKIKKDRLPIPPELDGEPPHLPRDISAVGDLELRRLHSEFNACLARANWLVAVEEADELAARQIADYHLARAVKRAGSEPDPVTNKAKTVAVLEAEAASDDSVREWRQRQNTHHIEAKLLKALRDTYQSNCERISREWTMRTEERGVTR
jgi:hypothetical protein